MKRIDGLTPNLVAERIEELKSVFPEVFKDDKIDFDALQNILGEFVEDAQEKYSFTWAGKLDSIRLAQKRSTGTLRPCREESVDFDNTQNLYIEGDNLEVLKLLSGSYMNKVKMIYIDPPYNTGSDFVYKDDFSDSIANYKQIIGEAAKSNPETAGRYHTNWLNMMLPRLKLARVLLKPDGVIFISIDDKEVANLKKLCDEVFGEYNFIAQAIHKNNSMKNQTKLIGVTTEYILIYVKNKDNLNDTLWRIRKKGAKDIDRKFKQLKNKGSSLNEIEIEIKEMYSRPKYAHLSRWNKVDENGVFKDADLSRENGNKNYTIINPTTKKECPIPKRGWGKSLDELKRLQSEDLIWYGDGTMAPGLKDYLTSDNLSVPDNFWYFDSSVDTRWIKSTFGSLVFENPKPLEMIKQVLALHSGSEDVILDFFSGSATTAHAVMQLNAEDGGKRKFICVQIPELVDEKSEAYKAGYKNICEIGKERIRRAGARIKENNELLKKTRVIDKKEQLSILDKLKDHPDDALNFILMQPVSDESRDIDIGFKVFKLDTSNLKKWNNAYTRDYDDLANRIREHYDYLTPDRTPLDMVYEIMLKYSLPLTLPVEEVVVADVTVHIISHLGNETTDPYKVLVCMQDDLTIEQMEALPALGARTLFFADRCFTDTNAVTNCNEILKKEGQEMRLF